MRLPVEFVSASVDFGFRRGRCPFQDPEVAAFMRLGNVLLKQRAEAALIFLRRCSPLSATNAELALVDFQLESAACDIELDLIAITY